MKSAISTALPLLLLAKSVFAVCGTHSFTTCDDNIVHWFDPNTGEICDPLDCGGGRAPPRKDVPGCPGYTGTETRPTTASYLSCWTPPGSVSTSTVPVVSSAEPTTDSLDVEEATETTEPGAATAPSTMASTPSLTAHVSESTDSPLTTQPPTTTQSTNPSAGGDGGDNEESTSESVTSPESTPTDNAGRAVENQLLAVAGVAIGAIALL